jgi:hypothetical protein
MGWRLSGCLAIVALLAACSARPTPSSPSLRTFWGMCDASGAVALDRHTFAVADDEDNVIRIYDADRPGAPVASFDLSPSLGLTQKRSRKTGRLGDAPETDIEGAARVDDVAYWITSHGLNSSAKRKPERFRFFATNAPSDASAIAVLGRPYQELVADLIADARYAPFALEQASQLAPKQRGALNVEGLAQRAEGGLFLGFRSPVPEGKALLAPLLNPRDVVQGARAQLGAPVLLSLEGLGIRDIVRWRGRYLILAGARDGRSGTRLFVWDGQNPPRKLSVVGLDALNPEGIFTPEDGSRVLLLSDDGTQRIEGDECKRLGDVSKKRFRGLWIDDAQLR